LNFLQDESRELRKYIKRISEKIESDMLNGYNEDILFYPFEQPLSNQGMEILIEGIETNTV
jgi:hypothetical protein